MKIEGGLPGADQECGRYDLSKLSPSVPAEAGTHCFGERTGFPPSRERAGVEGRGNPFGIMPHHGSAMGKNNPGFALGTAIFIAAGTAI